MKKEIWKLPSVKEGFQWGGSLSAIQVDGIGNPARSEVWQDYLYKKYPERHWSGMGPFVAIDFTRRYREDIETYKQMGVNSIRYGFMWARLFPDGVTLNKEAVKYYHEVIDAFNEANITLIMQLFHFDSPMWVKQMGGWQNAEVQKRFGAFAKFCFEEYGSKISWFSTFNEPAVMKGMFGDKEWWIDEKPTQDRVYAECFGLGMANAHAYYAFVEAKKNNKVAKDAKLGVVINYNKSYPVNPANPTKEDLEAVKYQDAFQNIFWTDLMLIGKVNEDVEYAFKSQGFHLPITEEQRQFMKDVKLDFMGENYYLPWRAEARPEAEKQAKPANPEHNLYKSGSLPGARMNHFRGWEIFAEGLKGVLVDVWNKYQVPLYIGENGMGVDNEERFRGADGHIDDEYRISFIKEHLMAISEALEEGVDVFGYHVWSITDLWSSFNGFKNRYGFVEVNLNNNLERRLKKSANWYKDFITNPVIKDDFVKCDVITEKAMQESLAIQNKTRNLGKTNYDLINKEGKK